MKTIILLILSIVLIFPAYGEKPVPMGMVLIQKGAFQMGSKKSMLELRPHDLFNTVDIHWDLKIPRTKSILTVFI